MLAWFFTRPPLYIYPIVRSACSTILSLIISPSCGRNLLFCQCSICLRHATTFPNHNTSFYATIFSHKNIISVLEPSSLTSSTLKRNAFSKYYLIIYYHKTKESFSGTEIILDQLTMNSLSSYIVILATALLVQGAVAQYPSGKTFKPGYCNICRDAPNNNVAWRNLSNPSQSFQMNGEKWTCQYLQDTVQDVNPYNGAPGEARWCSLAQTFAEENCSCSGPDIPSINNNVQNPNPACDLCQGQQLSYVPSVNSGLTANTGVAGNMNCLGLYDAMAQGVLTPNLCPTVIANAGPVCCALESIGNLPQQNFTPPQQNNNPSNNNSNNNFTPIPPPQEPQCTTAAQVCLGNDDCCPGLQCKVKVWNGPKYCSSSRTRPRTSIAGSGVGGAAGRSRAGN